MSIKAGRVGVNPSQVDPVDGSIKSSASSGYTKQEADAKFLTQSDAASTYESKSDASTAHNALQPKTLAVPLELLSGSVLTVETALGGINNIQKNITESAFTDLIEGSEVVENELGNHLYKNGRVVLGCLTLSKVTATTGSILAKIPAGYRPVSNQLRFRDGNNNELRIQNNGDVRLHGGTMSNSNLQMSFTWISQ